MKKIIFGAIVLTALFSSNVLFAHPPARIDADFDSKKEMLEATIKHPVANNNTHYVREVIVRLNGRKILTHEFNQQESRREQETAYLIPGTKGMDTLTIEAYCNMSGKQEKRIKAGA